MALIFDSNNYMQCTNTLLTTGHPATISCWFKSVVNNSGVIVSIGSGGNRIRITLSAAFKLLAQESDLGGGRNASSANAVVNGVWNHGCGVFVSNFERKAYLNYTDQGTNGVGAQAVINSQGGVSIGNGFNGAAGAGLIGWIAEVALWNINLQDAEVKALSNGTSPLLVHRGNLVGYWPLYGNDTAEQNLVGSARMIYNGSPAPTKTLYHPPVTPCLGSYMGIAT